MGNCSSVLQDSLAWCQGKPEYPGIKRRVYFIDREKIVSWPTLPTNTEQQITSATYTGDFTLATGAQWKFVDVLPDKCQLVSESQGETPSITQLNRLTLVHPGVGEEATKAALYFNNVSCVFLVETIDGKFRVVGNDRWDTITKVSQDQGQGATGTTSTTIEAEVTDIVPAPFYAGEIVTADGTINEG